MHSPVLKIDLGSILISPPPLFLFTFEINYQCCFVDCLYQSQIDWMIVLLIHYMHTIFNSKDGHRWNRAEVESGSSAIL